MGFQDYNQKRHTEAMIKKLSNFKQPKISLLPEPEPNEEIKPPKFKKLRLYMGLKD